MKESQNWAGTYNIRRLQAAHLNTVNIVAALHGLGSLGIRSVLANELLLARLDITGFSGCTPWTIHNFFWAAGQLELTPEPATLSAALAAAEARQDTLDGYGLPTMLMGLSKMQFYPGESRVNGLVRKAVRFLLRSHVNALIGNAVPLMPLT